MSNGNGKQNKEMTIAQFVGLICRMGTPDCRQWIKEHIRAVAAMIGKKSCRNYFSLPITSESATHLAYGFAARITVDMGRVADYGSIYDSGRKFLCRIRSDAWHYGIEIDPMVLDAIIEPGKVKPLH